MTGEPDICASCGIGHMHDVTAMGRTFLYRRGNRVVVPEDLPIPTCDHCGDHLLDERLTRLITEIGRKAMEEL